MAERNAIDASNYLPLLSLAFQVGQSIKGLLTRDPRWPDCQQLALKLCMHSASIYSLRRGTRIPLPEAGVNTEFYDLTSVAVLARACLDTFLKLFHVFFAPTDDDDFEFRYTSWKLAGEVVREGYVPTDPSLLEPYNVSQENIRHLRSRLESTREFGVLTDHQKKQVLRGKGEPRWSAIAREAGFGEETIRRWRAYHSGHVHADGLSGSQVVGSPSGDSQIEYIEREMGFVMIVLSKFICLYAEKWPAAGEECRRHADVYALARSLAGMARLLP